MWSATVFAMIGSTTKCGLPIAWTSPAARVAFVGTFMRRTPCEAWTRPGLPTSILGLRAFWRRGGSQPISSSAPPSMSTSASRSCTTKLGRASTKCESSVGFARTPTSTLSPPTSRASEPRSGRVATTLSLAWAVRAAPMHKTAKIKMRFIKFSEFVGAVGAEDEFELEENRIDIATGEEGILLQEIVVVLQAEFGKLGRIPGQVGRDPSARLPGIVIGERGFLHVKVIAANADDPTFLESPKDLRIHSPVPKRFADREQIIEAAPGFVAAIHSFGLPFHERETAFGPGALPFVKKIGPVNLGLGIRSGLY